MASSLNLLSAFMLNTLFTLPHLQTLISHAAANDQLLLIVRDNVHRGVDVLDVSLVFVTEDT